MREHEDDTEELQQALSNATSKEQRRRLQNRIAQRNHRKRVRQQQQENQQQRNQQSEGQQQETNHSEEQQQQARQSEGHEHEIQHHEHQEQENQHKHQELEDQQPENHQDIRPQEEDAYTLNFPNDPIPTPLPSAFDLAPSPSLAMDTLNKRNRRVSTSSFCVSCGTIDSMIDPSLLLDGPASPSRSRHPDWQVVGSFEDALTDPSFMAPTSQTQRSGTTQANLAARSTTPQLNGRNNISGASQTTTNVCCQHQHRSHALDALDSVAPSQHHIDSGSTATTSTGNLHASCSHHPQQQQKQQQQQQQQQHSQSLPSLPSLPPTPNPPNQSHHTCFPASRPPAAARQVNMKAGTSDRWTTPLHIAVDKGHEKLVRLLLLQGGDINEKDSKGSTILHKAAMQGNDSIVRILLEANADVDALDHEGWTALHRAAESGNEEVVMLLLGAQ